MLDSGTRIGETLSIEEDQINLDERLLRLPPQKTKSRKERTVFFSSHTANEIREWIAYKGKIIDTPLLFPLKQKPIAVRPQVYEANFQRYVKRVGISRKITPHTLRNNFAKRCLLSGMDIYTLSRLLGHSSVTITEKAYLDITQKDLQEKYQEHSPISSIFHDE